MFYCNDCKEYFDTPDTDSQKVPYGMGNAAFEFDICPHCGSDCIEEVNECRKCCHSITESENYYGFCAECIHENFNLPIKVFEFDTDTEPNRISEFAIKCLGTRGINELIGEYFKKISETEPNKYEKGQEEFINKYLFELGEWLSENNG